MDVCLMPDNDAYPDLDLLDSDRCYRCEWAFIDDQLAVVYWDGAERLMCRNCRDDCGLT